MTMEEKNELQNLIEKKWNWLKKVIGKNIIDFFQMRDLKEEEERNLENEEHIELLLEEANAYGLRLEVEQWAIQLLKEDPDLPRLEAYVQAYNEWVK